MAERLSTIFDRFRMHGNPAANPKRIVICGNARFTILTACLIRLEWSANGTFEDRGTFAFPTREGEIPTFSYQLEGAQLTIKTDALCLRYVDDGKPFHAGNLSIEFELDTRRITWVPGTINLGNLRGTRRTLDQCAGAAGLAEGLLSRDGWSLFDDSGSPVWDFDGYWIEARPDAHVCDWYFFGYGHAYKAALHDYVQFGGRMPLVPRFVLGVWWSRFWAYHADDLMRLVQDFDRHDIPLDVLVVDMDWHTPHGWTGYTWNRNLFPDPEAFLAWVHEQGLQVTFNLHPAEGVQKHEAAYERLAELLGRDPSLGEGIRFSATDKSFIQLYFELLHHPMEEQGVDFWWLDWQQGEATAIKNLDPLPWLNHLHFQDSTRRGTRPMLYSRWGGLGNHRYPIGFSGDTYATWDSLRFQPYFTATAANVGCGWWSHDIGGHFGATDPGLYARWVQFGAVSPSLRLHATKDPLAERRPWTFPADVYEAAKAAMQFRYELLPYLYSAAQHAAEQGLSLCTPMYYDYPEAEDAYLARSQYFLGDQIIVAPITSPADPETGLASIDVWIPDGEWIEFTTLETYHGPRWVRIQADLNRIPMFVRAGGIVPLAGPIMRSRQFDGSYVILTLFPGASGQFDLYEDDGRTSAYQDGEYEVTAIHTAFTGNTVEISVAGAVGVCPSLSPRRTLELRLRGVHNPASVMVNGALHGDWREEQPGDLVIMLPTIDRRTALNVVVNLSILLAAQTSAEPSKPFVHVVEYETYEDARRQLGSLVLVPPGDGSPFSAEVEWRLQKGSNTETFHVSLTDCHEEVTLHSPFADNGSLETFRWSVTAQVHWQGPALDFNYQSKTAYPGLNHWQTLIYNREETPLTLQTVLSPHNDLNPALPWRNLNPSSSERLNLAQPNGLVFLEQERHRITAGEPLEACLITVLNVQEPQQAILEIQCVGEHDCYVDGVKLTPTPALQHPPLAPMFYSWMTATSTCYHLSLQPGSSQLAIFTRPNASIGWWGVGATLFDESGPLLTTITESRSTQQKDAE